MNLTVDEQYADDANSCIAAVQRPGQFATSFAASAPDTAPLTAPHQSAEAHPVLDSNSSPGGKFTFDTASRPESPRLGFAAR